MFTNTAQIQVGVHIVVIVVSVFVSLLLLDDELRSRIDAAAHDVDRRGIGLGSGRVRLLLRHFCSTAAEEALALLQSEGVDTP